MPVSVAIAVVSWNTRDLLDRCLQSMRADADAGRAEVWVVDNGSTDGSPEMVAERHPWARLVRPENNLGFGRAVNLVARATSAPWIAAANADIALTDRALQALLQAGARDPRAGAIGPRLLLQDGSTQPSVQPFPTLGKALLQLTQVHRLSARTVRRLHLPDRWDPDRPARVPWVTGAFLLARREAFEKAGGFDEEQWLYAEDLDLCWRMRRAGWEIRYEPSARVHHAHSAASEQAFGGAAGVSDVWIRATYAWRVRRYGLLATWAAALAGAVDAGARLALLRLLRRHSERRWGRRAARAERALHAARLGLRSRAELLSVR